MNCGLLDFRCHAKNLAIDWWMGLPWYLQLAIIVGIGFAAWGAVERAIAGVRWVASIIHRFGGWQAVVGASIAAIAVMLSVVLALLPKKPKGASVEHFPDDHPDTKGPFEFGKKKTRPKVAVRPSGNPMLRRPDESLADWWERTKGS